MLVAVALTAIIPAIERWGVLVTDLGAAVVIILGALYVSVPRGCTFIFGKGLMGSQLAQGPMDDDPFRGGATRLR